MKNRGNANRSLLIPIYMLVLSTNALSMNTLSTRNFSIDSSSTEIDQTWQNGSDRRNENELWKNKHFKPNIILDINFSHSFNNPIDNTVVGSTAIARNNEVQLSALHLGGDFYYKNAHARVMTQFGTRSTIVPRNDLSTYRGQFSLTDAYKYISEANAGFHINILEGVNVDAGLFMSYIGLNSYYQVENWEYQASFTSDNTPWFFNGIRIQLKINKNLKVEPWIINGWQSYGQFNSMPGIGFNFTYLASNSNIKIVTNNYFGTETPQNKERKRFHSDNSLLLRYYNTPQSKKISRMALSFTTDVGFEKGGGVNGFVSSKTNGPAQYFLSAMFYNRIWYSKNRYGWTIGGGFVNNPGRYLILIPSGESSSLPKATNPSQTEGKYPFTANPSDKFVAFDFSTNLEYLINQSLSIKMELVHRSSNVDYFAGKGGVTSQNGYKYADSSESWRPNLVKSETRIIMAFLFRI